eukprot:750942-Hanusia_phi.AAC.11
MHVACEQAICERLCCSCDRLRRTRRQASSRRCGASVQLTAEGIPRFDAWRRRWMSRNAGARALEAVQPDVPPPHSASASGTRESETFALPRFLPVIHDYRGNEDAWKGRRRTQRKKSGESVKLSCAL